MLNIKDIITEAKAAAYEAAKQEEFKFALAGRNDCCGFAWVNIYSYEGVKLTGRTKMGKAMKAAGIDQDYLRTFQIWSPAGYPTQNISTHEAGARAAAEVFTQHGFKAYAGSRLD